MSTPYLSKTRYIAGLQCRRRLWLACRRPDLGTPADAAREAVFDMGNRVGEAAHRLFPGGVLVDEPYDQPDAAEARTAVLLADASVPAIFEAAVGHAGVRIRADVLERLGDGHFGLREVKASTSVKEEHVHDVAVQKWVLEGAGLSVPSAELVHVDNTFVRDAGPIDWTRFFARCDLTADADALQPEVAERIPALHELLQRRYAPFVEPSSHCFRPYDCEFRAHCTEGRSPEWHLGEKRLGARRRERYLQALRSGATWLSGDLADALACAEPPLWYLDFETIAPAIPLHPGTRPFQTIPVQWSAHRLEGDTAPKHHEFLAASTGDPRRAVAESLIDTLGRDDAPVAVWSGYESRVVGELMAEVPDRAAELGRIRARLVDLLPITRNHVYHPGFAASFSLKAVAPALVPGFGYADLEDIAEGTSAAAAFEGLVGGRIPPSEAAGVRAALLAYCERDTLALVEVHQALRRLARS